MLFVGEDLVECTQKMCTPSTRSRVTSRFPSPRVPTSRKVTQTLANSDSKSLRLLLISELERRGLLLQVDIGEQRNKAVCDNFDPTLRGRATSLSAIRVRGTLTLMPG